MQKGVLAHLATPGTELSVRVTPNARANAVEEGPEGLKVLTTATPEGGKANAAVREALAHALGLPRSRLTLVSGATSREKRFRVE